MFAKNEMGMEKYVEKYSMVITNNLLSVLYSMMITTNLLSVASIRRKRLNTAHNEERCVHTNSESCNVRVGT